MRHFGAVMVLGCGIAALLVIIADLCGLLR